MRGEEIEQLCAIDRWATFIQYTTAQICVCSQPRPFTVPSAVALHYLLSIVLASCLKSTPLALCRWKLALPPVATRIPQAVTAPSWYQLTALATQPRRESPMSSAARADVPRQARRQAYLRGRAFARVSSQLPALSAPACRQTSRFAPRWSALAGRPSPVRPSPVGPRRSALAGQASTGSPKRAMVSLASLRSFCAFFIIM